MKQVIIRIRDVDGKLRDKFYYTSQAQFNSYAYKDILESSLTSGYEIDIKFGNEYRTFKTYEELLDDAKFNCTDLDDEIYTLVNEYNVQYYLKQYLPRY